MNILYSLYYYSFCPPQELLGDSNPMVVANALAALQEIKEQGVPNVMVLSPALLLKLLRALNECTEWGQVRSLSWLGQSPNAAS